MDELNSEIRRLTLRVWDEVLSTKVEVAETVPTSAGPVVYSSSARWTTTCAFGKSVTLPAWS